MNIRQIAVNMFRENTYVAWKEGPGCVIVDPGCVLESERQALLDLLSDAFLRPAAILLTHGHNDHVYGVKWLQDRFDGIPVYMTGEDRALSLQGGFNLPWPGLEIPDTSFKVTEVTDGSRVRVADLEFEAIGTPGHSPGSVCWLERSAGVLFTGDTLFAGTIGRTDLPHCEWDDEIRSILEKLLPLDPGTAIFPGHGGSSTIGCERTGNPFLEPFNEKEDDDEDGAGTTPVTIKAF